MLLRVLSFLPFFFTVISFLSFSSIKYNNYRLLDRVTDRFRLIQKDTRNISKIGYIREIEKSILSTEFSSHIFLYERTNLDGKI